MALSSGSNATDIFQSNQDAGSMGFVLEQAADVPVSIMVDNYLAGAWLVFGRLGRGMSELGEAGFFIKENQTAAIEG